MPSHEVRGHYERHPYPHYPLISSIQRHDTHELILEALWARFNGEFSAHGEGRILLAESRLFAVYPLSMGNPRSEVIALDLVWACLRHAGSIDACSAALFASLNWITTGASSL